MRTAAIGIGSNSLRMLLADVEAGKLHRIKRYREGMRTFAALNAQGDIDPQMIQLFCEKVGNFARVAQENGAEIIHLFATSAVRDAGNQAAVIQALKEATGLHLEVCSGEMEARLSYLGAAGEGPSGLIDIGGGSTEIACGDGTSVQQSISLQMGAVRLCRVQAITDVNSALKVAQLAAKLLAPAKKKFLRQADLKWIGVGGTFTTAAALAQQIPWNDKEHIHHYSLTKDSVAQVMALLAPMPLEERLRLPSMQPQRADIVVHGIAILFACMEELSIASIEVSECGNLEGYLKQKYLCA